jgi:hypothetical protein
MTTSSVIETVRSFSFANKHWTKTGDIIECPPGTWCKPYEGSPPDWCALVCCPNCKQPAAISALIHKIDYRGRLFHPMDQKRVKEWTCPKCKLTLRALLNAWGKQTLFGIAFEQVGKPKMIYKHADDSQEAEREFHQAYPMKNIRIVAIGQVLGYYSEDKDDKVLTTS